MSLYLRNSTWIDPETFKATTTTIKVEEGPSGGMALDAHAPVECPPEDTVLDCTGRLVTPSFGCGHHHIYSALARGMPPAPKAPANFLEVLEYVWWRMDKKLDHDMIEASALVTGLYCAKNGVTFVIDHHASPFHLDGSLETIAKALDRVGLGHLLCYEISCRDGEEIKEKGLDETDAFLSSGRKGHVGLHASFTVDDDLLGRAVDLARKHKTGVHIHVAEGIEDQEHCARTYGKSVVRRLSDAGVLDLPLSILGHCVHLDAEERDIIRTSPCWVVQNTESNLNNNVGLGRYNDFPRVMLGTEQVVFRNTFRIDAVPLLSKIPVLGPILFQKAYVTTYLGILVLIVTAFILKRTRFGLRLRSCGENPQAADSVGISVYKMRYSGVLISGALAGLGGLVFILPTTTTYTASVSGYGFLAMSVVVFGQWKPWGIALGALFFGLTKTIAASYSVIPFLYNLGIPEAFFKMLPYVATLIVLAFSTKRSNAPGVIGVPYDKSKR